MSATWMADALAFVAMALALATGCAAIGARSLFAALIALMATVSLGGMSLAAFGAAQGALALIVVGVGVAPAALLGAIVLTARSAPDGGRLHAGMLGAAALLAGLAIMLCAPSLSWFEGAPAAPPRGLPMLLAVVLFVAATGAAGLLAFGERGLLNRDFLNRDLPHRDLLGRSQDPRA